MKDARTLVDLVLNRELDDLISVKDIQSAFDTYADAYIEEHSKNKGEAYIGTLRSSVGKKVGALENAFRRALAAKVKDWSKKNSREANPPKKEKEYLTTEAFKLLGYSSVTGLNTILRKYNLPFRQESPRKRYVSESTIEIIRRGGYKK